MLILEAGQICPHSKCEYDQGVCFGKRSDRPGKFTCEYANKTEVFTDGVVRNSLDQTGKMKPLMEQN